MAKASRSDAVRIKMKKIRAMRSNNRAKWQSKTPEERDQIIAARHESSLEEDLSIALWDYKLKQYPMNKHHVLEDLISKRLAKDIPAGERFELEAIRRVL